eukprot:CAMPEP_0173377242 /NCGR_PEP_ID=MMETSP1356-20130122/450_1 /TAXON_ID=77927 ORGANISM="Hemiselmis virescens, Strain PCC157" /NCGR_SAMPLE_ID=MMETSP1356 /ASSEMBLY_ACC=CAM_ASM_000847 /LENGTH=50 /DNA_ID=CAMNT_0014329891 /DNA_START=9 /DNA_END=161 /DNA_ORIENTATION=+
MLGSMLFDASGFEKMPPQFGSFAYAKETVNSGLGTNMPDYLWTSMDEQPN